HKLTP
ncbi:hypothetical protein D039_3310B, partial [Vibrio parahaemolyticus EKP-028]